MRFLQTVREVYDSERKLIFTRFAIFETSLVALYIHKTYQADKSQYLHSHPWHFVSLILRGFQVEEKKHNDSTRAGWDDTDIIVRGVLDLESYDRNEYHRIKRIIVGPVVSLFLTVGPHKDWGYLIGDKHVDSKVYAKMKDVSLHE
jgi:hypothetical protein